MEVEKKSLKKMFPNLARELEGGESKVSINSVRTDASEAEKTSAGNEETVTDKFRHYEPTVVDFIRRCDCDAQAEEIIAYLLKRGELTEKRAAELRAQLKRDGLRSFGSKKEENYYFKQGGIC